MTLVLNPAPVKLTNSHYLIDFIALMHLMMMALITINAIAASSIAVPHVNTLFHIVSWNISKGVFMQFDPVLFVSGVVFFVVYIVGTWFCYRVLDSIFPRKTK